MPANQGQLKVSFFFTLIEQRKRTISTLKLVIANPPVRPIKIAIGLNPTNGFSQHILNICIRMFNKYNPFRPDHAHILAKCVLYLVQIFKNVGVIKLNAGQYRNVRTIMQELGSFIEESAVIFIAFRHKIISLRHLMVVVKIFQPAADHETGFSSRCMKLPTQKGRGGGFAVRPSHHQGFSAFQEKTGQRLRERCVVQSGFQHRLHFFVGFGNRVANNDQVNITCDILLSVTRQNRNSRVFQKHAHGWIYIGIRS